MSLSKTLSTNQWVASYYLPVSTDLGGLLVIYLDAYVKSSINLFEFINIYVKFFSKALRVKLGPLD